jgi:hypothetical protein
MNHPPRPSGGSPRPGGPLNPGLADPPPRGSVGSVAGPSVEQRALRLADLELHPHQEESPARVEESPPEHCANPHCRRSLPAGGPALVVATTWSRANRARLCGFRCLTAWSRLMELVARARAAGELSRGAA